MKIGLLGPFEVHDDAGTPVVAGGPKQSGVLAVLALSARRVVPVDVLTTSIWPDPPPERAARTLSVYVSTLRRALEPHRAGGRTGGRITTSSPGYVLHAADGEVDASSFTRQVADARRAFEAGRPHPAREELRDALSLWRGEPIADLAHLPFAADVTHRLTLDRIDALELCMDCELAAGNHLAVLPELEELTRAHPLRERFWGHLMLALYRDGRQSDALAAFARARDVVGEETGLAPDPDLVRLQDRILQQDPALRASPARTRLATVPVPLDELIGRDDLVHHVEGLLGGRSRLVTLLGTGGVGKTRLALEVASVTAPRFPDGVTFADLSAAENRADVELALATALGQGATGPDGDIEFGALGGRELLLVCDNLEQVAHEADLLAGLLRGAPGLRVLVTSRVRLGVAGERVVEVPPLDLVAAMTLFRQRAREAHPGARWTAAEEDDLARLSRRLDGLPLAIEIMAARSRFLSPAQMDSRLHEIEDDERTRLATAGHHRSLRAAVDWSLDLLSPTARDGFGWLAVFRGGFTLEAVEALCADDGPSPVSGWLGELVDASLVQSVQGRAGPRFTMLETLRRRAASLPAPGDLQARHAGVYAQLGAVSSLQVYSADGTHAHLALEDDRENWLAALEWAGQAAPATAVALTATWRHYWGTSPTATRPVSAALDCVGDHADLSDLDRATADLMRASAVMLFGQMTTALSLLEGAVPVVNRDAPGSDLAVRGWCWLAAVRCEVSGGQSGQRDAAAARAAADASGAAYLRSTALDISAWTAARAGEVEVARGFATESIAIDEARGDRRSASFGLRTLGSVLVRLEDADGVEDCGRRMLLLYADGGLPEAVELAGQQTLAYAAVVRADPVEAAHWLLLTLPRWAEAGFDVDTVEDLYVAAAALALAGARAAGADVLASAQSRAREHDLLDTVPDAVGRHLQSLREEFDVDALPGVGVDVVLEELRAICG